MYPQLTSYSLLVSAVNGFSNNHIFVSFLMFLSFITSIFYHNNLHKHARIIDVYITRFTCLTYLILYFYNKYYNISVIPLIYYILGIVCYLLGVKYNCNKFHSFLHIFMALSSIGYHEILN